MPNPSPKIDHMPPPNPAAIDAECAPENRVKPAPDFGEPWIFEAGDIITSKDYLVCDVYSGDGFIDECGERGKRIVATMNACSSMRDPAAEIQALRDAVKEAHDAFENLIGLIPDVPPWAHTEAKLSLAKLKAIA